MKVDYSVMEKSVKQVLHLLALIDRREHLSSDTWLAFKSELVANLDILLELEYVVIKDNEYILTNKGKNILNYYNQERNEETIISKTN
jgi:hypothetical protein